MRLRGIKLAGPVPMDPLTAACNLFASLNGLLAEIVKKAPPEAVAAAIDRHEARIARFDNWFHRHFGGDNNTSANPPANPK